MITNKTAAKHPLSTVAWSVHEAITHRNRSMSRAAITLFLQRAWDATLDAESVDAAVAELLRRGRLTETQAPTGDRLLDTTTRDAEGKRISPPHGRNRDANSSDYGWF